jgi:hypothetical protein
VVIGTGFSGVSLLAAVGDLTGDGWPDLTGQPAGDAVRIYPGNGLSALQPGYVAGGLSGKRALGVDLTPYDWVIGISDIGLTGHADLVVRKRSNGKLFLLPGTASGFGKPRFLARGMGVYDLAG